MCVYVCVVARCQMWEEMLEVRYGGFVHSLWTSSLYRCVEDEKDETLAGESVRVEKLVLHSSELRK